MIKLVTFTQAQRLKELGFDYDVIQAYSPSQVKEDGKWVYHYHTGYWELPRNANADHPLSGNYSAPSISEALDWIRDKFQSKGIYLSVRFGTDSKPFYYGEMDDLLRLKGIATCNFDTHQQAESALLDAVLDYLERREK